MITAKKQFEKLTKKTLQTYTALNDLYDTRLCGSNTV